MARPKLVVLGVLAVVFLAVILALGKPWLLGPVSEKRGATMTARVEKTDAQWREQLTPEQYRVTRQKGTECAFTGAYWNTKTEGIYQCVCCGQSLFDARTKFDSGTGWPSFWAPVDENQVALHADNNWFMRRTEVICSQCAAHLGHVFEDGPQPTGLRYCINSASLKLVPRTDKEQPPVGLSGDGTQP